MVIKRVIWSLVSVFCIVGIIAAQDESCPALVQTVLETVQDACNELGRNEVCYGNDSLTALDFASAPVAELGDVGDVTEVFNIASLETAPFDLSNNTWGVAILSLQADLPDTLPGQNVTFVIFGDTQFTNQVIPEDALVESLPATSTGNINVRSGAGTNSNVVGTLSSGEEVTIIGRNAAGDWVQIEFEDDSAWVFADLLTIEGDISLLATDSDSGDSEYSAPMQAFSLQSGIGQSSCEEVPPDGVLVQAPTDTTVHFLVNGIEVEIGSTAFLQFYNGTLYVSTLEGIVTITVDDVIREIEPGFRVSISGNATPSEPSPFDYDEFFFLPVSLLPEIIGIPLIIRSDNTWRDSGIAIEAGDTFAVFAGGIINFWDFCETQKVANGQPDIDCDSLILGPDGGDPTTLSGEVLLSDMSLFPVSSAPPHSLVARIGSSSFFVGTGGIFTATDSGNIEFRANDVDYNNIGNYFVAVILES